MALYRYATKDDLANLKFAPTQEQTMMYNALSSNSSPTKASQGDNFFTKKAKSIENALGTTAAAAIGGINEAIVNSNRDNMMKDNKTRMNEIARKYGYNTYHDVWDARDRAEAEGDQATLDFINNTINPELQGQATANKNKMDKFASDYKDYVQNDYIGQKTNQDQGKFLGSAINTMSTATDVLGLTNGPLSNAVQGGLEGIADELEQSGFKDFSWERAGQNALTGAASGAATGALNAKINGALAKRGGNLLKGGNKLTQAINSFNTTNPVGQLASSLGTGAARGAISGAVGGATGAGLSAAMNNRDVLGSALQGAKQGAISGAGTGAIMTGANMAIDKTPGVGKFLRDVNQAQQDWKNSGDGFNERLTNTLTSGDSPIGEWVQGNRRSKLLGTAGNIGNRIIPVEQDNYVPLYHQTSAESLDDMDISKRASINGDSGIPEGLFLKDTDTDIGLPGKNQLQLDAKMNNPITFYDRDQLNAYMRTNGKGDLMQARTNIDNYYGKANDNISEKIDKAYADYWEDKSPKNKARLEALQNEQRNLLNEWSKKVDDNGIVAREGIRDALKAQGYDSVILENDQGSRGRNTKSYIVFDKEQLRDNSVPVSFANQQQTPTTLGGWLKKAGQRIVEDVNNRGSVGMSVKDVSGDGMLDLKAGETAPNARLKTLSELSGGEYNTLDEMINDGLSLEDLKSGLSKKSYNEILKNAKDVYDAKMGAYDAIDVKSKSDLPVLNRQQYYEDTLGTVKGNKNVSYKDVPDYMKSHLSDPKNAGEAFVRGSNDEILRDLFRDQESPISDLYARYEELAQGTNANEIYTPENIIQGLALAGKDATDRITSEFANNMLGGQRDIKVQGNTTRPEGVKVKSTTMPQDIRNMKINDGTTQIPEAEVTSVTRTTKNNPQTQIYNQLTQEQEPIDLTSSFGDKGLGSIGQRNKLQALGQQLQNSAKTQKYAPIYDSLDARTAKRAAETNAPQQLADLGVKPQDYNEYAKTSSYVNRVVSDLAKKSGIKVNAPDLPTKLSADNIDVVMSDSALKKYNGYIKQIVPDGDSPTQYSASYLLEKSRELGNKAANLRGNTDDVSALRQALTDAKYTLRDIATNALEGSLVTGDATNDMIAQGLKNLGANEKVQDYYTEAVDGKAPSVSDYIRRSALFEQARDMGIQVDAEKYTRSASKAPTRFATKVLRASGLEQPIETLLRNTVAPIASGITNVAGKAIEGAGNIVANRSGRGGTEAPNIQPEMPTNNARMTTAGTEAYNPSMNVYNAIGRNEGRDNAQQARTADYLVNAAQEAEVVNDNTNVGTTMDPQSTSMYNTLYGQTSGTTQAQTTTSSTGYFQPTGDYWTDILASAMSKAIDADDVEAFASLYGMYQDQLSNLSKSQEKDYSNPVNWNSTDRKSLLQAQNGLDQIESLESSYNNAVGSGGGNLIQGTLRQWSNNISGGNLDPSAENYVKQANSIGAGIIKNLVNLGSTEYDAQRYIDYLPKLTDTKEQAAQKLQVLRNAYENVIQNLRDVYSA